MKGREKETKGREQLDVSQTGFHRHVQSSWRQRMSWCKYTAPMLKDFFFLRGRPLGLSWHNKTELDSCRGRVGERDPATERASERALKQRQQRKDTVCEIDSARKESAPRISLSSLPRVKNSFP